MKRIPLLIDGRDVDGEGESLYVVDPSTGDRLGILTEATAGQVAAAVAAAARTFTEGVWANRPVTERQTVLRRAAAAIRGEAEALIALQIAEGGMNRTTVARQIEAAAGWFDYFADFLSTLTDTVFTRLPGATTLVERVPIGVCALFSPWNVPVALTAIKLAPALAAGNSVVVKPSEETPGVARRLIDLVADAGVPDGVVNLVNGRGHVTGRFLAEDSRVNMIAFTGGPLGGRAVAEAAARRQVPCVTELGGKSATIVFADSDLTAAVEGAITSAYGANGEACLAGTRLLLQEPIAEAFIQRFRERAETLVVGPANSEETFVGPMISASHRETVLGFYDSAEQDGDEVLFGGPMTEKTRGFFVRPGAIRIASNESRVWREEAFGPLVAVATFEDETDAISMANDSDYGLSGYLWTSDLGRAHRVARRLRTGTVVINAPFLREPNAPFGGFKASGVGREGGAYSWQNVTHARTTVIHHG